MLIYIALNEISFDTIMADICSTQLNMFLYHKCCYIVITETFFDTVQGSHSAKHQVLLKSGKNVCIMYYGPVVPELNLSSIS